MMIRLDDLAFGHSRVAIGSKMSLSVHAGEVLAVLGPNGVGKTTLFRTILGLQRPLAGRVLVDGTDLAQCSRSEIASKIAYVPQAHGTLFPFRALDIVVMGRASRLTAFQQPGRRDRDLAFEAMARLGIQSLAHRPYTEISGGERQLVLIARALAQEASFLVLDEPTASLDYGHQFQVLEQIRLLAAGGKGILLSTHNPDHAFFVADRAALMAGGSIVDVGEPQQVLTPAALRSVFGVDVVVGKIEGSVHLTCAPARISGAPQD
ncbi:ABC transporter ATP-binding protein [Rhizobium sp. TRM96647]|uniref:ABC transporter ATP-binding protein n=1 Tax=unclassified Rhizobium TaxID=2613769 RepID=UPI0021E86521|nr:MULTISPECIES: ABC transporter ATP-binding protein [unclassified Rhizobium]MCV3736018.1 ABC transporter ATP-binding protein [Rhizobium sp. TRM96647]MCV3758320.1 ABC transporter ATP-binding protein [Rhizobium sp. TRM96650]